MQWETRIHWIWGFFVPSRWYLFFLGLEGLLSILVLNWPGLLIAIILLGPIVFGSLVGLVRNWFQWIRFSLSVSPTGKAFLERQGFRMIAERRINMNMIGTWTFKQTFIGQILDYGSLSIGALGGPYEYENLGQFRALRRIIETQGDWMPSHRPNILVNIRDWISLVILRVVQFFRNIWQAINAYLKQLYVEYVNNQAIPNYTRFLYFAEKVLFNQNSRRYESAFSFESMKSPLTEAETRLYYRILKARKVIIANLRGLEQRHHRIQTLDDLKRHIPADWFYKALKTI